jgi:hypothetical protein
MKENIIGIVPDARKRNARVKSSVFVVTTPNSQIPDGHPPSGTPQKPSGLHIPDVYCQE